MNALSLKVNAADFDSRIEYFNELALSHEAEAAAGGLISRWWHRRRARKCREMAAVALEIRERHRAIHEYFCRECKRGAAE